MDSNGNSTFSGKPLQFSITTEGAITGTATLDVDYTSIPNTASSYFTILAGSSTPSTTITLDLLNDTVDEYDQTVVVSLAVIGADSDGDGTFDETDQAESARDGDDMLFTYTIVDDDDPPTVYFTNSDEVSETENGSVDEGSSKTFGISLSAASEKTVTIY